MKVYLYQHAKRVNSTKVPGSASRNYDCVLKESSSAYNPTIIIKWDGEPGALSRFNYAYIPVFSRFYWILNWTYENRCWVAVMTCDVLASFKTQIGECRKYVLRSASEWGAYVMDTKYPTQLVTLHKSIDITNPDFATSFSGGTLVVGIIGEHNTFNVNGAGYIVVPPAGLNILIDSCFNASYAVWDGGASLGADIGEALAVFGEKITQSIQNPIQFINSVMWLPFTPDLGGVTSIHLGMLSVGNATVLANPVKKFDFTIDIPNMSNLGRDRYYHLAEPYSHYKIVFPPFGVFDIPGAEVIRYDTGGAGKSTVSAQIVVDCISGQATLSIPNLGICSSAQLGIPLELSGQSVDWASAIQQAANTVSGVVNSAMSLNAGGVIANSVSGIIGAERSMAPVATQGFIGGGMAALNSKRHSCLLYYPSVETDPDEQGYALCEVKLLSSLSGYILCADGDVGNIEWATKTELEQISEYLTGGFFYE